MKLERSGGLDYFLVGEERCVFPALLTPGCVDGGYCHKDNVDAERLRGGHLEFDPGCTTCTSMTMRGRQHRRQDKRETAGSTERSLCGSHWKIANAYNGSEYLLVALRRETRFRFVKALANKRSETIKDAMVDMQLLRGVWRFHSDEGREFMGTVDDWQREHAVLHTTTIQTRAVLSKTVLGIVVFDGVFCAERCACACGVMQRNTQTKSTTTASDQCLDRATWRNRSCWRDVLSRDNLNVICCQERSQVRGHSGVV